MKRIRIKYICSIIGLFALLSVNSFAQTSISGVINNVRSKVTGPSPVSLCASIQVADATGFVPGDKALIIQMKGAAITTTNTNTFGNVTAPNNAGNYETGIIASVAGTTITFTKELQKTYDPAGSVQLIKVLEYTDAIVAGTLNAPLWDGNTGGVIAFEVTGTLTLNANIDATGAGFRGGGLNVDALPPSTTDGPCTSNASNFYLAVGTQLAGGKGEGISDIIVGREHGQGRQANGGGGGHSNNAGGGGGANFGAGGLGGRQTSSGCLGAFGNPGLGGFALNTYYSLANAKIFLGGGGGGGHQNNRDGGVGPPSAPGGTPGARGGGIVFISANQIIGNGFSILANGQSLDTPAWGDGGGGGGGGGVILLSANSYSTAITLEARGGKGDRVYTETNRNLGPGGGGGGGVIWFNSAATDPLVTTSVLGGPSGVTYDYDVTHTAVCQCPHGAVAGSNGSVLYNLVIPSGGASCTPTPVSLIYFEAQSINNKIRLQWATAQEVNNDYFLVERSQDLLHYEKVAEVKAQAHSTIATYEAIDRHPLAGITYYRLSQYDLDGTSALLSIRAVQFNQESEALVLEAFPNPAREVFQVDLREPSENLYLSLYNAQGAELFLPYSYYEGTILLQTMSLSHGIYILKLSNGYSLQTLTFIK